MSAAGAAQYVGKSNLESDFFLGLQKLLGRLRVGRRVLWRLSFTVPPAASEDVLVLAADEFVREFAKDVGAWLVLDESKRGKLHWYGIVVTRRARTEIEEAWRRRAGLNATLSVKKITGQGDPWASTNGKLWTNLRRVVAYSCKTTPTPMDLTERVVASGKLLRLWTKLAGAPPRSCEHCGVRMSAIRRANAKFCSSSCRTLHYKHRKRRDEAEATLATFPPTEDEVFADVVAQLHPLDALQYRRAALVREFECGLYQGDAEREALFEMLDELHEVAEPAGSCLSRAVELRRDARGRAWRLAHIALDSAGVFPAGDAHESVRGSQ